MRLRQIADMERTWTENGITLLKFFLHISQAEQERRFQARLDDPKKRWKAKKSDFKDRRLWGHFQRAYEESISYTTRRNAPWYVVPANHKWYRDVVIAQVLLQTMQEMKLKYPRKPGIKKLKLAGASFRVMMSSRRLSRPSPALRPSEQA